MGTVGNVICTKTGYVLFDMQASAITSFSQRLGEKSARELGLNIRPKAVNHISLACNRPEEDIRDKIKAIYEPQDGELEGPVRDIYQSATFDLVLSSLLHRSSFERMAEDGPHRFREVARIPVVRPAHDVKQTTSKAERSYIAQQHSKGKEAVAFAVEKS